MSLEIRIWNIHLAMIDKYEELELVKIVDIEMYKDLDFGGFVIIDGKSYRQCSYDPEKDILCVESVILNAQPEEDLYDDDFICPFCGYVNHNAWEYADDGECECRACGSELEYERIVSVSYNVTPKKCAPVTVV